MVRVAQAMKLVSVCLLTLIAAAGAAAQDFVFVPGGALTVELAQKSGVVEKQIRVEDFLMASTEVTVGQWKEFVSDTGLDFPWTGHYCGDIDELSPSVDCPIMLVGLDEAAMFCNWMSERDGLRPVYQSSRGRLIRNTGADGYRLPTADEWDYAARGGTLSKGYLYAGSDDPEEVAWLNRPYRDGTRPVGLKKPNELGLYDMTGNIWEWTWPENGVPVPVDGVREVAHLRGGGWTTAEENAFLSRDVEAWVFQTSVNGFRLARNAD